MVDLEKDVGRLLEMKESGKGGEIGDVVKATVITRSRPIRAASQGKFT